MKISISLPKFAVLAASLLISQAYAAAAFTPDQQPLGFIGPIELSDSNLVGGVKGYRGWFENGAWQGDLIEYDISAGGALSTSIDLLGVSPVQTDGTNWSAYLQFDTNDDVASYWNTGRKIITRNGTAQVPFRWKTISASQRSAIEANVASGDPGGDSTSNILNFIRGDRSLESPAGTYRARYSLLGDIIHSKPEYVKVPSAEIPDSSYVTFINANLTRAPRVYVGANDGMLHAFDATNGNEVWAYIPSMVIDNVSKLAGRPFSHNYFVDGGTTASDGYFAGDTAWHTVLVGSLGSGGKGLYALDVTHPGLSAETATTGNDKKILWEIDENTSLVGDDVGYVMGSAVIAKLNDDVWYAVTGNGVSSVNGVAKLFIINLETGAVKSLTAGSANGNGLSPPALVDTDNDGRADIVYAGDIDGDLWKFDLTGVTPASWYTAYELYDGAGTQPITTAPEVTTHPVFGHLVLYGTGRLYTADDILNTDTQALFGIWDKGTAPVADTKLAKLFSDDHDYLSGEFSETVRTIETETPINWSTHTGWITEL
ncbi:MAG: pilus assembly protein, partial [Gammaproteobacteria bacterium]